MSGFPSKRNPAYVNMVDETGAQIGTAENPLITQDGGSGGTSDVNVQNFPTWSKSGELLQGQLEAGVEKLVAPSGATAIWIQSDPQNTDVIRVGTVPGFSAAWIQPGDSEWFYGSTIYLNCASAANFATQAVKYG